SRATSSHRHCVPDGAARTFAPPPSVRLTRHSPPVPMRPPRRHSPPFDTPSPECPAPRVDSPQSALSNSPPSLARVAQNSLGAWVRATPLAFAPHTPHHTGDGVGTPSRS